MVENQNGGSGQGRSDSELAQMVSGVARAVAAAAVICGAETPNLVMELAKLDGAFIVRGDGLIRSAGTFLATSEIEVEVPAGLGARHVAAAAITAVTSATTVVVSATDGFVRVFSNGELVLQMDPDLSVLPLRDDRDDRSIG